ncbi:MAG: SDR family oxidoreductase [Halioglobus sp.]|jgi:NAD(P)-dependent dehydrogenase (short-subunit alcohol dehydrogenase family)|nr:SDR family oxidoreductase [Halieaceae bacterium]MDG1388934.1 SDR family oxidoreductase [Halioglobus sp.]MBT5008233.1 SDR family oxidoreductase [Halieaceae bacterium]MBT6125167.1 SDR family oxidoreductase [Halieaceae bacterium]MBT7719140.1 SDR family oxidoreductase [Halieaceae bacterium]
MSVVLVTGASTGIGQTTSLHLASKGHKVFAGVRSPDTAHELKERIATEGGSVALIQLDVTDQASVDSAVQQIMDEEGRIDVLVNNAGVGGGRAVEETPLEEVRGVFETNYFGISRMLLAITPIMRKQRGGRIVNMSSLAGRMVFGCHGHYSAAKWALEGLSEALAMEMAEFNVRVALIEPGSVPTPAWEKGTPPPEDTHYGNSLTRLATWATFTMKNPASTQDVADAVSHAIESDKPQFRYLVGQDAVEDVAGRQSVSDDEWIEMNRLQGQDFAQRWKEVVGVDYFGADD